MDARPQCGLCSLGCFFPLRDIRGDRGRLIWGHSRKIGCNVDAVGLTVATCENEERGCLGEKRRGNEWVNIEGHKCLLGGSKLVPIHCHY